MARALSRPVRVKAVYHEVPTRDARELYALGYTQALGVLAEISSLSPRLTVAQVALEDRAGIESLPEAVRSLRVPFFLFESGDLWDVVRLPDIIRRPRWEGERPRFQLSLSPERATEFWQGASAALPVAHSAAWTLLDIRAGIAPVGAAISERFVPQMLNYDRLGAISFSKGCYTGQEVIARAHYKGAVKRRMQGFSCPGSKAPTCVCGFS